MPLPMPLSPSEQLTQKARAALDLGRPQEAARLLMQALAKTGSGSEEAIIMERLSYAFQQTGEKEAALLWAERAVAASPDWCWAYLRRTDALDDLGRSDEAIHDALTALRLSPELPLTSLKLARLYTMKKAYADAEIHAARFQELAPDDADAYYYPAAIALDKAEKIKNKRAYRRLLEQAESSLQAGLANDPTSPYLQRLMGRLRDKQKRRTEAFSHYFEAARGFPDSPHEQWQARSCMHRLLFIAFFLLVVVGWAVQGMGFLLGWGAWAACGAGFGVALFLEIPLGLFPQRVLRANPLFHKQPPQTQTTLLQMAAQKEKVWRMDDGITGFGGFSALLLNLPPLLLRLMWSLGVWAYHSW